MKAHVFVWRFHGRDCYCSGALVVARQVLLYCSTSRLEAQRVEDDRWLSYAFTSPDGQSEVRVSATYHLNLPDVLPENVLDLAFPNERGLAAVERIRGKEWDGLRREYTNAQHTKHWLG